MRDTDLNRQLLGLEKPWTVDRVELDVKQQRVDVFAKHEKSNAWTCPECGKPFGLHDHDKERVWRHLDSCGFQTFPHARIPRVSCPEHGVRQVRVSWAEPKARFTALFQRFAIDVHHMMERAVARGMARRPRAVPKHLGIDEKSLAKGQRYATMVCDLERGDVIDLAEDRTKDSVLRCLGRYSIDDLAAVEGDRDGHVGTQGF